MAKQERFWEIDFFRGIAIIMMIIFHFLFDLNFFAVIPINVQSGFWFWFARATATIFIFLAGIAMTFSHVHAKKNHSKETRLKFLRRGLRIFGYGLIITIATWLLFPKGFIIFGILHFIGVSIMLSQFFLKWKWKNIAIGAMLLITGIFLQAMRFDFPWLLWLGFPPKNFYTFDYFPLLPWFGVFLAGIFAGNLLYPEAKRIFKIKELGEKIIAKQLCWLGKHSLAIYLLHQPILIAIILAVGF